MQEKEIVLFTAEGCEICEAAKKAAKKISLKHEIPVRVIDVMKLGKVQIMIPKTCLARRSGNMVEVETCFTGFRQSEYEEKLEALLR